MQPKTPGNSPIALKDDCQTPTTAEEIKLTDAVFQTSEGEQVTPPPTAKRTERRGWIARLCTCFGPTPQRAAKPRFHLRPQRPPHIGKPTLIIDLDETLVHSSFHWIPDADFAVSVNIESGPKEVCVRVRPGAKELLQQLTRCYEIVVFTASVAGYAEKVLDALDEHRCIAARLYRESCTVVEGVYVKNLAMLGRDLRRVILIDVISRQNSSTSYQLQPENALPIESWLDDPEDGALYDLIPALLSIASEPDLRQCLRSLIPQLTHIAEERRLKLQLEHSAKRHLTNAVPHSPSTHAHDHGSYNSPKHGKEIVWSEVEVESI